MSHHPKSVTRSRFWKGSKKVVLAAAISAACVTAAPAATIYWTGDQNANFGTDAGGNTNWSTAAGSNTDYSQVVQNGDLLWFSASGAANNTNINNDQTSLTVNGLYFAPAGGTFGGPITISGNALALSAATAVNSATGFNKTSGNATVTVTAANEFVAGMIIAVSGTSAANANGTFAVATATAANFTYAASTTSNALSSASGTFQNITTIFNPNTTAGRDVTISTPLSLSGTQAWVATHANGITNITGNLSGSGSLILSTNGAQSALPSIRLSGSNSGFTGTISIFGGNNGVMLMNGHAMIGGNININEGDRNIWLQGGPGSGTYTFGLGAGANAVQIRNGGTNNGLHITGGNVDWRIGGTNNYTLGPAGNGNIGGHIRYSAQLATDTTPYLINLGNAGDALIFGKQTSGATGNASLAISSSGGLTILNIRSSLQGVTGGGDFTVSSGTVVLNAAAGGDTTGATNFSGGTVYLSSMNQIFSGNLNLSGGAVVIDNRSSGKVAGDAISLDDFLTGRTNTTKYGTGANQWQGIGFAARNQALTLNFSSVSGASNAFDNSIVIGSTAQNSANTLYADKAITITQDVTLSTGSNRTWTFAGSFSLPNSPAATGIFNASNSNVWNNLNPTAIHQYTGKIGGGNTSRTFTIVGSYGVVRLSNTTNDFITATAENAGIILSNRQTVVLATDDAVFGNTSNSITLVGGGGITAAALLWENTTGTAKTYTRNVFIRQGDTNGGIPALGSYAGDVVYTGTQTLSGDKTGTAPGRASFLVQSGSTFQLGSDSTPATLNSTRSQTGTLTYIKSGSGSLILKNISYGFGSFSTIQWQIGSGGVGNGNNNGTSSYFDGAIRETGTGSTNSLLDFYFTLAGGVLETSGNFTRSLNTSGTSNFAWAAGGGGFAAFGGALNVNIGSALTWAATSFVTDNNPLIFGSETADNTVTLQNAIALAGAIREIRVVNNVNSTADKAVLAGVLSGNTSSGLNKTGTGILELASGVTHTYGGATNVSAGRLIVNGTLNSQTSTVTVNAGATLGGSGTINRAVVINGGGTLAPGNSIGTINIGNTLTANASSTLYFEVGAGSNNNDKIAGLTAMPTLNGGITIDFATGTYTGGTSYDLITWSGGTALGGTITPTYLNLANIGSLTPTIITSTAGSLILQLDAPSATGTNYTLGTSQASTLHVLKGGSLAAGNVVITNTGTGTADTLNFTNLTGTTASAAIATVSGTKASGGPLANTNGSDSQAISVFGVDFGNTSITASVGSATNATMSGNPAATLVPPAGAFNVNVGNATASSLTNFSGGTILAGESDGATPLASQTVGTSFADSIAEVLNINANVNTGGDDVTMVWRTKVNSFDIAPMFSDVVQITTADTNFVLKMYYSESANENAFFLGKHQGSGLWASAGTAATKLFGGPAGNVGDWGIDTTNNYVWAVLNSGGDFAVIPEPTSLSLLGLGAVGLLLRRRRK